MQLWDSIIKRRISIQRKRYVQYFMPRPPPTPISIRIKSNSMRKQKAHAQSGRQSEHLYKLRSAERGAGVVAKAFVRHMQEHPHFFCLFARIMQANSRTMQPKEQAIYKLKKLERVEREREGVKSGKKKGEGGEVNSLCSIALLHCIAHAIRLNSRSHYAHKFHDKCKSFAVQYATSSAGNNSQQ